VPPELAPPVPPELVPPVEEPPVPPLDAPPDALPPLEDPPVAATPPVLGTPPVPTNPPVSLTAPAAPLTPPPINNVPLPSASAHAPTQANTTHAGTDTLAANRSDMVKTSELHTILFSATKPRTLTTPANENRSLAKPYRVAVRRSMA
jgi:hypothetical protein